MAHAAVYGLRDDMREDPRTVRRPAGCRRSRVRESRSETPHHRACRSPDTRARQLKEELIRNRLGIRALTSACGRLSPLADSARTPREGRALTEPETIQFAAEGFVKHGEATVRFGRHAGQIQKASLEGKTE